MARDEGFARGVRYFRGAIHLSGYLEASFVFAADAFGVVFVAEFFGAIVAVFLEGLNVAGETAGIGNRLSAGGRIGGEVLLVFGFEEELGEVSGGDLKADFGELAGVALAEVLEDVVLGEAVGDGAVLFGGPCFVAAAGFPVRDISFGDLDAVFVEGADDLFVRDMVAQHTVDHVAFEKGKASDFAVADLFVRLWVRQDLKLRGRGFGRARDLGQCVCHNLLMVWELIVDSRT